MLKILFVTPIYEPAWKMGGVVRAVSSLACGIRNLGHEVSVYTTNSNGKGWLDVPINIPLHKNGVKVWYFNTPFPKFYRYSKKLAQACKENVNNFDIIHMASFWNYPGIPAARFATKYNIPYVISTFGTLTPEAINYKKFKKLIYMKFCEENILKHCDAIHYETYLERLKMSYFKIRKPSFVIPSGLFFEEYENLPISSESKNYYGFSADAKIITFLGRLHKVKALDVLIKAFTKITTIYPETNLILAGPDDGEEKFLKKLVNELNLNKQVRFIGPVSGEKKMKLFSSSDIFVLISHLENFGNAAIEAMAAGVPVLISENVGICDAVREDGAGLVVPVEEDAISNALINMFSNSDRLKEMGRAAYLSARKRFDIKLVAKLTATAYEDVLTGGRSPECNWAN